MKKISTIGTLVLVLSLLTSVAIAGQPGMIEPKTLDKKTKNIEEMKKKISGDDDVRVIITLKEEATDQNIDKLQKKIDFTIGKKGWTSAYPNGFAATVKRKQLDAISKDPLVDRVDEDRMLQIQLETANYWSGVTAARAAPPAGYGVDGDRDGKPNSYSNSDIVIAVIDTGIDPKHKDLTGLDNTDGTAKIIGWHDAVSGRSTPYDDNGHGTHVASIAAGDGDSNARYKGVAPGAALVGVKVCTSGGFCLESDIIEGFNWVITNKDTYNIKIMTVSLGSLGSSDGTDPISVAANNVVSNGIVTTIAAGNSGDQRFTVSSPGTASNVITVGAIADPGYQLRSLGTTSSNGIISPDKTSQKSPTGMMELGDNGWYLAPFSSRGLTADLRLKPDVVAPGVSITAADAIYPNTANYHGGHITYSGTSMATPFVAGVVAMILDANPALTPAQVKKYIKDSTEDFGINGCDFDYGCGRVRPMIALALVTGTSRGYGPRMNHQRISTIYKDSDNIVKQYPVTIKSDNYPIAVTLIQYDWSGYWPGIDLDVLIENVNGNIIGGSLGYDRQETVVISPENIGTWQANIYRWIGSGRYAVDISYG